AAGMQAHVHAAHDLAGAARRVVLFDHLHLKLHVLLEPRGGAHGKVLRIELQADIDDLSKLNGHVAAPRIANCLISSHEQLPAFRQRTTDGDTRRDHARHAHARNAIRSPPDFWRAQRGIPGREAAFTCVGIPIYVRTTQRDRGLPWRKPPPSKSSWSPAPTPASITSRARIRAPGPTSW